jgi:tetratricopeptide (TPR) repeat protein
MSRWETGLVYYQKGFYHAAYEAWRKALEMDNAPSVEVRIANGIGWIYSKQRMIDQALQWFSYPENQFGWHRLTVDDRVRTANNIANAHARNRDFDLALQTMTAILPLVEYADPTLQAIYYLNLSSFRYSNEMYPEMLQSAQKTLDIMTAYGLDSMLWGAHTNLGLAYLRLGKLAEAEAHLLEAYRRNEPPALPTVVEVSRLYRMMGNRALCYQYSQHASERLLSESMSVEQEEYASLLEVFGYLSMSFGDLALGRRFFEKAELQYGAHGMWREWEEMQQLQRALPLVPEMSPAQENNRIILQELRNRYEIFNLYDSLVSQFPVAGRLADFAVPFAAAMGEALQLHEEEKRALQYACRLQYTGWTVVGEDVIRNRRSNPRAAQEYRKHPSYGADLLQMFPLPQGSVEAVRWQLERWDEHGGQWPLLARILAVISTYVLLVEEEQRAHSEALETLANSAGSGFDPEIVQTFLSLFERIPSKGAKG